MNALVRDQSGRSARQYRGHLVLEPHGQPFFSLLRRPRGIASRTRERRARRRLRVVPALATQDPIEHPLMQGNKVLSKIE